MASKELFNDYQLRPERVSFYGRFFPNGASAVTNASNVGDPVTVTRVSAGLFDIKTTDAFSTFVAVSQLLVQMTAATDQKAQFVSSTKNADGTWTMRMRTIAIATETDIAAAAGNQIHFSFIFENMNY